MKPTNIVFELEAIDACYQKGVRVPQIVRTAHGYLCIQWGDKLIMVMHHISGDNMDKQAISDSVVHQVGYEIGKMDQVLKVYHDGHEYVRQHYEFDQSRCLMLVSYIPRLHQSFDQKYFKDIIEQFKTYKHIFDALPKGVIHNDITLHNILVKDNTLMGIVDFSDMAYAPYIQNIAVTMSQMIFTYNWQPHQAKIFIQGYERLRPLWNIERDVLYELVCVRFAVLVLAFTKWHNEIGEDDARNQFMKDNYTFLTKFIALGKKTFNQIINQ